MAPEGRWTLRAGAGTILRAMPGPPIQTLLAATSHRPWPLPERPWVMFQSWQQLLFAHWRLPRAALRPHVPAGLEIEEFDGSAWLGIVPFLVTGLRGRGLPPLPGLSRFPEVNLRTYVSAGGRPGVYFFSLDADSRLAVLAARTFYHLPYHAAAMGIEQVADGPVQFFSRRRRGAAEVACSYRPTSAPAAARPGTLEHFLAERYALYAQRGDGRLLRGDIHHLPWPLCPAEGAFARESLAAAQGLKLPAGAAPLLHFAARQDTLIFWPVPVDP